MIRMIPILLTLAILLNCNPSKKADNTSLLLLYLLSQPAYTSTAVVTTFAGSTAGTSGFVDATGTTSRFNAPCGIAIDTAGNIFLADTENHAIRKITSAGVVTTFAGSTSGTSGYVEATGTAARFLKPRGIAVDSSGNLYVSDQRTVIRKITNAGVVSTLAGGSSSAATGLVDGTGAAAGFNTPEGVTVDSSGNVYVADFTNNAIRKITSAGVVTTLAGSTSRTSGFVDGTGATARFSSPTGIAVDTSGNLYVADSANSAIRKITSSGVVTTFAGSGPSGSGFANGTGTSAKFFTPFHTSIDSSGNIYVADEGSSNIRKISSTGEVTTLAGASTTKSSGSGFIDGIGAAARFASPRGIAVDTAGIIYVGDSSNSAIRKIVQ